MSVMVEKQMVGKELTLRRHRIRLAVLREVGLRSWWECALRRLRHRRRLHLTWRVAVELAGGWSVLAPAAFQRTAIDLVPTKLTDSHGGILVRVHFDEGEAAVRLEAGLGDVAEVLEQRHQIVLGRVRGEVADVAGGLPLWSLGDDHLEGLSALGWEGVVAAVRSRWSHAHLSHGLLLSVRRLAFLVRPITANRT